MCHVFGFRVLARTLVSRTHIRFLRAVFTASQRHPSTVNDLWTPMNDAVRWSAQRRKNCWHNDYEIGSCMKNYLKLIHTWHFALLLSVAWMHESLDSWHSQATPSLHALTPRYYGVEPFRHNFCLYPYNAYVIIPSNGTSTSLARLSHLFLLLQLTVSPNVSLRGGYSVSKRS